MMCRRPVFILFIVTLFFLNINTALAQGPNISVKNNSVPLPAPPNISYKTPQTYNVNKTITPLIPKNTGGAIPANAYGQVTTVAGTLNSGNVNGIGKAASFNGPAGLVFDAAGNLYISETNNSDIRKMTPAGLVSSFAGNGSPGNVNGAGSAASFTSPYQLAIDATGDIFVADYGNNSIRKITPAGVVTTFAGNGTPGTNNGSLATATFYEPIGIVIDAAGEIYVADSGNGAIRKIDKTGQVYTFAVLNGGALPDADAKGLYFLAADAAANLYFGNTNQVEKSTSAAAITVLAGNTTPGFADGNGVSASFDGLVGVAVNAAGDVIGCG